MSHLKIPFFNKVYHSVCTLTTPSKAIDNVMLSNGPVSVNGIPRGLALDSAHIRLTEKIKRFLQECIEEKINSLEAEERAISVLTNR